MTTHVRWYYVFDQITYILFVLITGVSLTDKCV